MEDYLNYIKSLISEDYLKNADLELRNNSAGVDSFVISSPATIYRQEVNNVLFARIKTTGKQPYISFKSKYKYLFDKISLSTYEIKSDVGFFRIALDDFLSNNLFDKEYLHNDLSNALNAIFIDSLSFPAFGCCSYYIKCSDNKKCIHDDQLYATACMYRKNLENNRIFYGKNKNV